MTDPTARTPYCTKIRYGVSGAPEIPVDVYNAPDITLAPTLVEIRYLAPRGEQPAFVDASVSGYWMRGGERVQPEKEILHHFKNGPDGWPVWLAAEARLHAPAVVSAAAPSVDRAALRDRIAEALYEACMTEVDAVGPLADAVLAVLPAPADRAAEIDQLRKEHETWRKLGRRNLERAREENARLRADHAAALERIGEAVRRLAAHAVGFQDVLDDTDRGPWGRTVGADIAELRRLAAEAPATTADKAAELGMTPADYRAASHRAAVEQVRAAAQRLYAGTALRVLAALDEEQSAAVDPAHAPGMPCEHGCRAVADELSREANIMNTETDEARCDVEFEGGGQCSKAAGHRTLANQDPHTPAEAADTETQDGAQDRG